MHNLFPDGRTNGIAINLKMAAVVSLILVLPFAILELLYNTLTRQNLPGLIVLFLILWLLPTTAIVILTSFARSVRAGHSVISLLLKVVLSVCIAVIWVSIVVDQIPCFIGIPNCD